MKQFAQTVWFRFILIIIGGSLFLLGFGNKESSYAYVFIVVGALLLASAPTIRTILNLRRQEEQNQNTLHKVNRKTKKRKK